MTITVVWYMYEFIGMWVADTLSLYWNGHFLHKTGNVTDIKRVCPTFGNDLHLK